MTERIAAAFGVTPYDVYATTEGLFGAECERHDGIHLFDDACVVENVDEGGRAVPPGTPGARVLVTNLYNLVQPIIRLAIADVLTCTPSRARAGARSRGRWRSTVATTTCSRSPHGAAGA